ncbi:hypothetical protein JOB18_019120 [Solea senegalensis]|uniref:Uncharacterized protein n=1 Tax=Solea senegalensis TaxID=28829 RepID=A0AAV6SFB3_SOLSE|nr:hypothetical protein JOB18_019120 [Solea senegalensis]
MSPDPEVQINISHFETSRNVEEIKRNCDVRERRMAVGRSMDGRRTIKLVLCQSMFSLISAANVDS